jgi:hypothetical protein
MFTNIAICVFVGFVGGLIMSALELLSPDKGFDFYAAKICVFVITVGIGLLWIEKRTREWE